MGITEGLAGIVIAALIAGSAEATTITDFRDDDLVIKHEYSEVKREPAKLIAKQECKKIKGKRVCSAVPPHALFGGYSRTPAKPTNALVNCNCASSYIPVQTYSTRPVLLSVFPFPMYSYQSFPQTVLVKENYEVCMSRCTQRRNLEFNCRDKNFNIRHWRECK